MDELMVALDKNGFDKNNKDHILGICGDLLDRGNKTVELFEFAKSLQEQDRLIYVRGNHEDLLFDCMRDIKCGKLPRSHHFHNQTIKTIFGLFFLCKPLRLQVTTSGLNPVPATKLDSVEPPV